MGRVGLVRRVSKSALRTAGVVVVAGFLESATTARQSDTQSVWDGVFTNEQALRGQRLYADACTSCHRDDLSGNEDGAPALRGDAFLARWQDRPLSEFLFVLSETMPQDAPKSLTAKQYADIISYVLKSNGAPAGTTDLLDAAQRLSQIRFTGKRGLAPLQ